MLPLFYVVLLIALTSVGLLFYLLFRRRVSLSILRARGYLGIALCAVAVLVLVSCAAAVTVWNDPARDAQTHVTDTQYVQLTDLFEEYADHTLRLERAYQSTLQYPDRIRKERMSYQTAVKELDRLTDKALLLKSSFSVQTIPPHLPSALEHRLSKMMADDRKAYEAHIRLLLSIRQELSDGNKHSPTRRVSREVLRDIRLLVMAEIPAYTDTNVRIYKLRRDIDETYRHIHD